MSSDEFGDSTTFRLFGPELSDLYFKVAKDAAGDWVLVELTIRKLRSTGIRLAGTPSEPPQNAPRPVGCEITSALLRQIRLAPLRRYARHVIAQQTWHPTKTARRNAAVPGRPMELTTGFYRRVGARYMRLVSKGDAHPAKTLAAEFDYSRTGMRSLLLRYRKMAKMGLLPPL